MSLPRYIIAIFLCGATLLISPRIEAQSFDCKKATTVVETFICNDESVGEFDQQLADAVKKLLSQHPDWKDKLMLAERYWVQYRDLQCMGLAGEPGKMDDCLRDQYARRLAVIESDDPLTGAVPPARPGEVARVLSSASENLRDAWFLPSLTSNQDPVCQSILVGTRRYFATPVIPQLIQGTSPGYPGLKAVDGFFTSSSDRVQSSVQVVPGQPNLLEFREANGRRLYVEQVTNEFCGGACETQQLVISESPTNLPSRDAAGASTPQADGWEIYETPAGKQYVIGTVDGQLEVYSVSEPASWRLACKVALSPGDLKVSADANVQKAARSIEALSSAVERVAGGEGYSCGTMHTAGRWSGDFASSLAEVLYRPWAVAMRQSEPLSANSYGDYARIYPSLAEWSLGGLFERRAFDDYRGQLESTTREVADFYGHSFHWSAKQASAMARQAITDAVGHRFGFYLYNPYPIPAEEDLREAILDHKPLTEIEAVPADVGALDSPGTDSILNVALEYPEAMAYLLKKGVNPNLANAFGKTPLMYAAQDNQPEAVKLLLQAGADPNATTTVPADQCFYALRTTHVTPLHYAARYAGQSVIRALLDGGAATFISAEGSLHYPIDWLRAYTMTPTIQPTALGGHERNPNLTDDQAQAVAGLLQVPNELQRKEAAARLVAKAESANASGKPLIAYQAIQTALSADANNPRAIADLPLLAIKAGEIGPALAGATRALAVATTPSARSAAWFNRGLACQRTTARLVNYDGSTYCLGDRLEPFLRAWQLEPTAARATKLLQLLHASGPGDCVVTLANGVSLRYKFVMAVGFHNVSSQRIYVLHPSTVAVDPESIEWRLPLVGPTKYVSPHTAQTIKLDDDNIVTVLEDEYVTNSPMINGKECSISY